MLTASGKGDNRVLLSARAQARSTFQAHSSLAADSEEAQKQIREAEEVAVILRQNVVQGVREEGNVAGSDGNGETWSE